MFAWLANAWRVPELRRRVLFTAGVLSVYRLGSIIPAPGVDQKAIQNFFSHGGGSTGGLALLNLFSGQALSSPCIACRQYVAAFSPANAVIRVMATAGPALRWARRPDRSHGP